MSLEFFTQEDVALLKQFADKRYDKNNPELKRAREAINEGLGEKFKYWVDCVVKEVFPNTTQPYSTSNIINTWGSHFKRWLIARAYPEPFRDYNDNSLVFVFAVRYDEDKETLIFEVYIQTKDEKSVFHEKVLQSRGKGLSIEYTNDKSTLDWKSLIQETINYVNRNLNLYWSIRNSIETKKSQIKDIDSPKSQDKDRLTWLDRAGLLIASITGIAVTLIFLKKLEHQIILGLFSFSLLVVYLIKNRKEKRSSQEKKDIRRNWVRIIVTYIATGFIFVVGAYLIVCITLGEIIFVSSGESDTLIKSQELNIERINLAKDFYLSILPVATGILAYWFGSRKTSKEETKSNGTNNQGGDTGGEQKTNK